MSEPCPVCRSYTCYWIEQDPVKCSLCGKTTTHYCSTLACPDCHKSISFEDCIAGKTGL